MIRLTTGRYVVTIDRTSTKNYYDTHQFITEDCGCSYCANYRLACDHFPQEIQDLFDVLGIDPRKEGEVSEVGVNADGTHLYVAFYHLVGEILAGPGPYPAVGGEHDVRFVCPDRVEMDFSDELDLVPDNFPQPAVQFEIQLNVPWLLD
ncbi:MULTISPECIES: hypothetical protein [Sporosarcina]|uniref:hypothetical protein n=1 Tax=Sporosarcina TaxID=1569 RepID=UPI0006938B60|nr:MULTISPECIES: hypothetical protein [Sporosarcina]WJY27537.1 hypothetical protein QWT68_00505 [Sporosarcina sp. 0.2-SM1T-5]